jgi:nucleoside-triphosphatase THEP1
MAPKIAVTGPPGVGKSTVVQKVVALCKTHATVGGLITVIEGLKENELDSRSLI